MLVRDSDALNRDEARAALRTGLAYDHGHAQCEPGYLPIRPRLLAERLLTKADGSLPLEHKFFVFDGRVRVVLTVVLLQDRTRRHAMYDLDWGWLRWRNNEHPAYEHILPRPARLEELIVLAERLAAGLDHLRVDTYDTEDEIYVGELTPYNQVGMMPFDPDKADFVLGSYWHIRAPLRQAIASRFR